MKRLDQLLDTNLDVNSLLYHTGSVQNEELLVSVNVRGEGVLNNI
jgi:hypothetical protein